MPDKSWRRVRGGLSSGLDDPMPAPRRSGSMRAVFWAIICVAVVAVAAWWLTRSPAEKTLLRENAAEIMDNALAGTPLAGMGGIIAESPPPPPPEVTNPPTDAGTLAGRQVTGTIAAPMDFGSAMPALEPAGRETGGQDRPDAKQDIKEEIKSAVAGVAGALGIENAAPREPVVFSQDYVEPVKEDSTVKPGYLASLARWLVSRYRPGPNGGSLRVSAQSLNQECGVRLAGQAQGGRSGLLRYALQPAMVDGLYRLYIDRFMTDLNAAAASRGLDQAQNRDFHKALAGRAALMASGLEAVLRVPDLSGSLARIDSLARKTVDENAELATAVFELDELRSAPAQAREAAQLRVDGASARYRRAAENHAGAQRQLARSIRQYSGPGLDDDTLLYMAAWVGRREAAGADAKEALKRCAAVLHDLAARCQAFGG